MPSDIQNYNNYYLYKLLLNLIFNYTDLLKEDDIYKILKEKATLYKIRYLLVEKFPKNAFSDRIKNNIFTMLLDIRSISNNNENMINIINSIIRYINVQNSSNSFDLYLDELYARSKNKYVYKIKDELDLDSIEKYVCDLFCSDIEILYTHLDMTDEEFIEYAKENFENNELYVLSILRIFEEYPKIFDNLVFSRRVKTILNQKKNYVLDIKLINNTVEKNIKLLKTNLKKV